MPALHRASAAASRSLCWDGERVPPCAQQQPWLHPEHGGPCPSPAASCALQRGQQPRETGAGWVPGCGVLGFQAKRVSEPSQSGRARVAEPVADGRWAKMLRVKECSKRSLLVVSVSAGAEGWLWPRRKRDWTGRRRQSCLLSSEGNLIQATVLKPNS